MVSLFIGVYTALYPYTAQTDQEISLQENDLLYLLEKSTTDDWWKVKKRVLGSDTDEPVGLVPNNYIAPAPVRDRCRALYEYDKQTEEELSFRENDEFDVYDASDADWILVGDGTDFGFVPSNYIEMVSQQPSQPLQTSQQQPSQPSQYGSGAGAMDFPPPPKLENRQYSSTSIQASLHDKPLPSRPADEAAPALPTRPGAERARAPPQSDEEFYTWNVQEVDGRRKKKAKLAVGNGFLIFSPDNGASQQWDIQNLTSYNSEKKHVFLELSHPPLSLDLHAGSKDTADKIISALGDVHGAAESAGLTEVYVAAKSAGHKMGKMLYDFDAEGDDEVSARAGDNVFVLDDSKSREWWYIRNSRGQEGMMPSAYIDVSADPSAKPHDSAGGGLLRSKSRSKRANSLRQDRESRERERSREASSSRSNRRSTGDRSAPDANKIRTWTDRSGAFKVDAAFLGCADGKIHLHKLNGVKIAVAASKMSVEDLEFVEQITGINLDDDKPLVDTRKSRNSRPTSSRSNTASSGLKVKQAAIPAHPQSNGESYRTQSPALHPAAQQPKKQEYDWFAFFLDCGVDVNNCQRYAINFQRDQMDESILPDINSSVLRSLGLKEGDILRVTKKLDEKFSRRHELEAAPTGGLFTNADGSLKNNTAKNAHGNGPAALAQEDVPPPKPARPVSQSFEDDAWQPKGPQSAPATPAPAPAHDAAPKPVSSQPTGSMVDLLGMSGSAPSASEASGQPLYQQQLDKMQISAQPTGGARPLQPATTGGAVREPLGPFATGVAQEITGYQTGFQSGFQSGFQAAAASASTPNLLTNNLTGRAPLQQNITGGAPQATGFNPLYSSSVPALQPARTGGAVPLMTGQPTGPLQSQLTGGNIFQPQRTGPLQGQLTGGNIFQPQLTGGNIFQQPQQTGANIFQQPLSSQITGGNIFQQPVAQPMQAQRTGPLQNQLTGGNIFQQPVAQPMQAQRTGPLQNQLTGGNIFQNPGVGFQNQPTAQFNQFPTGNVFTSSLQQQPTVFSNPTGAMNPMTGLTNQFQQTTISAQNPFGVPFGQNSFGAFPQQQQQQQPTNSFAMPFNQQAQQPFGMAGGQQQQSSFAAQQPLQGQPTGFGFGNSQPPVTFGQQQQQPLQSTPTGVRRANLAAASANNPFGF